MHKQNFRTATKQGKRYKAWRKRVRAYLKRTRNKRGKSKLRKRLLQGFKIGRRGVHKASLNRGGRKLRRTLRSKRYGRWIKRFSAFRNKRRGKKNFRRGKLLTTPPSHMHKKNFRVSKRNLKALDKGMEQCSCSSPGAKQLPGGGSFEELMQQSYMAEASVEAAATTQKMVSTKMVVLKEAAGTQAKAGVGWGRRRRRRRRRRARRRRRRRRYGPRPLTLHLDATNHMCAAVTAAVLVVVAVVVAAAGMDHGLSLSLLQQLL